MPRSVGHIKPDMTLSRAEVAAEKAVWKALEDEIEQLKQHLRAIRNHWNEFGPENGFEDVLERACDPIDINKGAGSTWSGLPKKSPAIG